eukprot:522916_1
MVSRKYRLLFGFVLCCILLYFLILEHTANITIILQDIILTNTTQHNLAISTKTKAFSHMDILYKMDSIDIQQQINKINTIYQLIFNDTNININDQFNNFLFNNTT